MVSFRSKRNRRTGRTQTFPVQEFRSLIDAEVKRAVREELNQDVRPVAGPVVSGVSGAPAIVGVPASSPTPPPVTVISIGGTGKPDGTFVSPAPPSVPYTAPEKPAPPPQALAGLYEGDADKVIAQLYATGLVEDAKVKGHLRHGTIEAKLFDGTKLFYDRKSVAGQVPRWTRNPAKTESPEKEEEEDLDLFGDSEEGESIWD